MTATNLTSRAAIAATVAAAALAVLSPVAHADAGYGAVATGPDGKWAISWGQPGQALAKYQANYACASNSCAVVTYFSDCVVLTQDGAGFHTAIGATQENAEQQAHGQNPDGTVLWSACNDAPAGVKSYRG